MKLIEANLGKIVFARLFEGEELLETINLSAKQSGVNAGVFSLIGTLKNAKVGFYREGKHHTISVEGPLEIVSCTGNISLKENKPFSHAHICVSDEKGEVKGGHVMPGCVVGVFGELVLIGAQNAHLHRKLDKKTNLFPLSMKK